MQYYRTLHKMEDYFLYLNRSNKITITASGQHVPGFCALLCLFFKVTMFNQELVALKSSRDNRICEKSIDTRW